MPITQESQISDYRAKIEQLTVEVRNLIHQRKIEADKTVAQINSEIPVLQAKKAQLEKDLSDLQQAIIDNGIRANEANKTNESFYKNLEIDLTTEYKNRHLDLDKREQELNAAKADQEKFVAGHNQAVADHEARVKEFESKKVAHEAQVKTDLKNLTDSSNQLAFRKITIDNREKTVNAKVNEINILTEKMNVRDAAFKTVQRQADAIIARIDEAQKILDEASRIKQENAATEIHLNQLKTESKAQAVKDSQRKEALDKRESELNDRQKNIELLEAKHG